MSRAKTDKMSAALDELNEMLEEGAITLAELEEMLYE